MTAPPLKKPVANCKAKKRHATEFNARAAAMSHLQKTPEVTRLWVYQCRVCHGWHLTSSRTRGCLPVTADDPLKETYS